MDDLASGATTAPVEFGAFLKSLRHRIDAHVPRLGSYERLHTRVHRQVTQEEIAEALGVSRGWYGLLESGATIHASTRLLSRIAETLMLTPAERTRLFQLALPDLEKSVLRSMAESPLAVLHELHSLRCLIRRVWSATSESEILSAILEQAQSRFNGSDLVVAAIRVGEGKYEYPVTMGEQRSIERLKELSETLHATLTPAEMDEAALHRVLTLPGQAMTIGKVQFASGILARVAREMRHIGVKNRSFLNAHVRSSENYRANISIGRPIGQLEEFTELDATVIGAFPGLASLALSRTPFARAR